MLTPKHFRIASIIWILLVTYASLSTPSSIPKAGWLSFEHADKLVHFCMYFGMTFWVFFSTETRAGLQQVVLSLLLCISYGGLMEIAQSTFTMNRQADWLDFGANSFGAFAFICISSWTRSIMQRLSLVENINMTADYRS